MSVQRYLMFTYKDRDNYGDSALIGHTPTNNGDWVKHEDVAALLASHARLVEALKQMRSDVNRSDYQTRRAAFEKADAALLEAAKLEQP